MILEVGATYLKMCGAVLRIRGYLQWLSSPISSGVMANLRFCAKILAGAGPKGS